MNGFHGFFWVVFITRKCVEFRLTSFGTLKYDFVRKTVEMFNFLSLINNSLDLVFYY